MSDKEQKKEENSAVNEKNGELLRWVTFKHANTAGMIIRPAMIAIAVSKISTFVVEPSMDTSFFI